MGGPPETAARCPELPAVSIVQGAGCLQEYLDVSHNELERFPPSTEQFWSGSLVSLFLHHNLLDQVDENILKLGKNNLLGQVDENILKLGKNNLLDQVDENIMKLGKNIP